MAGTRMEKLARDGRAPSNAIQRRPSHLPPPIGPQRALEGYLVQIWQAELGIGPIGIDDEYFELDGDSVSAVNIFLEFEKKSGIKLDPAVLVEFPTIRALAAHARADASFEDRDGILTFRDSGTAAPVFFVPGVRGEALTARWLAGALGDDIPFYGIQNMDAATAADADPSVEDIAGHLASVIRKAGGDGPYVLAGYCAGAILAYETARQLRGAGADVPLLVMLDAVNKAEFGLVAQWAAKWRGFRRLDTADAGLKLRQFARNMARAVLSQAPATGGGRDRPTTASVDLFQGPGEQAIRAAYDRYRPKSYDGPIALYTSDEYRARLATNQFGWAKLATAGLDVVDLPTNHFGMLTPKSVELYCDDLRRRIIAIRSKG